MKNRLKKFVDDHFETIFAVEVTLVVTGVLFVKQVNKVKDGQKIVSASEVTNSIGESLLMLHKKNGGHRVLFDNRPSISSQTKAS